MMIKEFLEYKKKNLERNLQSILLTPEQKQNIYNRYIEFIHKLLPNENQTRLLINLNFCQELIKSIIEKKIPLIMDQFDLQVELDKDMPNSRDNNYHFNSIEDFIAIHKSQIIPQNDTIITPENNGLKRPIIFIDPSTNITHETSYLVGNDTIHFTLNCPVLNHQVGNDWDHYPYAIITDFKNLEKDKVLDVKTEDTYIEGNAKLTGNYFILCPYGKRKIIEQNNPNAIVIEYKDISLNDAISMLIIFLGKKLELYGTYGWNRDFEFAKPSPDSIEAENIISKNNYPILKGQFGNLLHSESKYMTRRIWKREYRALISLLEYNKKNNINMPDNIITSILLYNGAYSIPGTVPVSIDLFKEYVIPILNESGYEVDDSIFIGIEENNEYMKVIDTTSKEIPIVYCPTWENELRIRIISLIKEKNLTPDDTTTFKM